MLEKAYTTLFKNMVRTDGVSFSKLVTALRTAAISPNNLNYYRENQLFRRTRRLSTIIINTAAAQGID